MDRSSDESAPVAEQMSQNQKRQRFSAEPVLEKSLQNQELKRSFVNSIPSVVEKASYKQKSLYLSENSENKSRIQFLWKGKILYRESLILQEQLKKQTCKSKTGFILGFECPACVTLGVRGQTEKDLSGALEEYQKQKIEIVAIKRGGQATLHSSGQLVIYPIMDLLQWKVRPRDFLSFLEKVTKITLKEYGILVEKQEDSAGLFTDKGKIAFFGIHISGGVSQHGLAINVKNDLKLFNLIRSCGVSHRPHDSFQSRGLEPNLEEVFSLWCKTAESLFLARL